ncbi:MAG TPA: biotin--[acetyl-CoA-carboxylase] ligase [Lacipirellulaceae bacterium]|jgi:BirA family biotin operon repressor/biotin-[acetyl-CoA-carboxylase] ligase|nr:biotin--[acetyl-CoA-carboxylase] ligase [Lacipirellulaceae bacterium]
MFDAERIRTRTFVRHIEIHTTLGSTNDRAAELARDSTIDLPALVVARLQTAGKGRGRNRWWSADGAITFSLLVDRATTGVQPASWPQLSLATAVAICDALSAELESAANPKSEIRNPKSVRRLGIKWPNDVILDGGKVGGILIESPGGAAPAKDRLIVGIGVNVNNSWRSAPRSFGPNGIALCDVTETSHNVQTVLIQTLNALQQRIRQLVNGDSTLPDAWQRLCWLTEQGVDVHASGHWITGVCLGIDRDGALLVENVNGVHRVRDGSVRVT